jgi:replication factor C subunit 1
MTNTRSRVWTIRGDAADAFRSIKINEKNTILTPFTIIDRLTHPYAFSKTNKESLNEKSELYFHDISFVPLFMQVSEADQS